MAAPSANACLLAPWLAATVPTAGARATCADSERGSGAQLHGATLHSPARPGPLAGASLHVLGRDTRWSSHFSAGLWLDPFRKPDARPAGVPDTRVRRTRWGVSHRALLGAPCVLQPLEPGGGPGDRWGSTDLASASQRRWGSRQPAVWQ